MKTGSPAAGRTEPGAREAMRPTASIAIRAWRREARRGPSRLSAALGVAVGLATVASAPGRCLAEDSEPSELDAAPVAVLQVRATAYTHTEPDHIPYGKKSALGTELRFDPASHTAAADWSFFPLGTVFRIRGYDRVFVVEDYGRALVGKPTVDIYFDTMEGMRKWGARQVWIEVVRFGSFHESRKILAARANHAHCRAMLARMTQDDWYLRFKDGE
jgi:3D (Asp-Asp-Asp) domain-containing protein